MRQQSQQHSTPSVVWHLFSCAPVYLCTCANIYCAPSVVLLCKTPPMVLHTTPTPCEPLCDDLRAFSGTLCDVSCIGQNGA